MSLQLQIDNDFSAIAPASAKMREFLEQRQAPDAAAFLADLVIEELVTNTIKYGYDDERPHCIQAAVDFADDQLIVEVRDDGREFDPLARERPDTTLTAEERGIGGLGIHLVCEMSDSVRYERRDGWNVVTARKTFPSGPGKHHGDSMTVKARHEGGALVVVVEGRLDHDSVDVFEAAGDRAIAASETFLVVDFNDVDFLASLGIRALLRLHKELAPSGGRLVLANPGGSVRAVLEVAGIDKVIPIFDSVADAIAARS